MRRVVLRRNLPDRIKCGCTKSAALAGITDTLDSETTFKRKREHGDKWLFRTLGEQTLSRKTPKSCRVLNFAAVHLKPKVAGTPALLWFQTRIAAPCH